MDRIGEEDPPLPRLPRWKRRNSRSGGVYTGPARNSSARLAQGHAVHQTIRLEVEHDTRVLDGRLDLHDRIEARLERLFRRFQALDGDRRDPGGLGQMRRARN